MKNSLKFLVSATLLCAGTAALAVDDYNAPPAGDKQ